MARLNFNEMVVGTVYKYKYCPVFFVNIDTHLQSSNYSKKCYDKRDIFENIRFLLLRALLFTKYAVNQGIEA